MSHPIHRRTLLGNGMGALGAVALESLAHAAEGPTAGQASNTPDAACSFTRPLAGGSDAVAAGEGTYQHYPT